jgi:8-oxo-dGTP pyrophosphatase MutT (NUDIX family)
MKEADLHHVKSNLPHVPGIQGKEDSFNAAVLAPLVMMNDEYHFLFDKPTSTIRQGGEVCFPGGHVDRKRDASHLDIAVRETMEELGVSHDAITIVGGLETLVPPLGVTVDPYLATLHFDTLDALAIDTAEVERVFMIPVSFFETHTPEIYYVRLEVPPYYVRENENRADVLPVEELQVPLRYHKPWGGRKQRVFVYRTSRELIWGITAALIRDVVNKLKPYACGSSL